LIAPSNYTARDIYKYFPDVSADIKVLYPDIKSFLNRVSYSTQLFSASVNAHPYFLVIGIKCPRKNVEIVIESLKILKSHNKCHFKVYFVGNLRETNLPINSLIEKNNLQDIASVVGYLSEEAIQELIQGSIGLIFPSQYEGFGIPLLEFLGAYKPVICTENTSIPEVVGDLAYYVMNNANAFADAIYELQLCSNHLEKSKVDIHLQNLITKNSEQYNEIFEWISMNLL
jgi:glycosyltransferase involved in cell wall biosynthesis